jgi:hypothetical protein
MLTLALAALAWMSPAFAQGVVLPDPLVITPAGQSADGTLARVAIQRAGVSAEVVEHLGPEGLEGVGTLMLVLGGSQKGLGAAGIDIDGEVSRTVALLDAAEELGIPVVGVHIGGEARRGALSEPFIMAAAPRVDLLLVAEAGNADGYFSDVAAEQGIPLELLPNALALGEAVAAHRADAD